MKISGRQKDKQSLTQCIMAVEPEVDEGENAMSSSKYIHLHHNNAFLCLAG